MKKNLFRFGLCCQFSEQPITFRKTTATSLLKMDKAARALKLAGLCAHNAQALHEAISFCSEMGIGAFRVNSQILPLKTHPDVAYRLEDLPDGKGILRAFESCGRLAAENNIRLSFHPDQFVVLNSPDEGVVHRSVLEIEYQNEVAEWMGADVINIHGGGGYGNKREALFRLAYNLKYLSDSARSRLTFENDDRIFSPSDLLPVCEEERIPLVYDVHHHRCLADGLTVSEVTQRALATWSREPLVHLSSPRDGWQSSKPNLHHDFINPEDFPEEWKTFGVQITIDIEAKAKELAVLQIQKDMQRG